MNFPPTLVLSLIETIYQVSQYQTNIESAAANLILSLLLLALLSYYLIWQRQFCNFFEKSCTIQLSKFQFLYSILYSNEIIMLQKCNIDVRYTLFSLFSSQLPCLKIWQKITQLNKKLPLIWQKLETLNEKLPPECNCTWALYLLAMLGCMYVFCSL